MSTTIYREPEHRALDGWFDTVVGAVTKTAKGAISAWTGGGSSAPKTPPMTTGPDGRKYVQTVVNGVPQMVLSDDKGVPLPPPVVEKSFFAKPEGIAVLAIGGIAAIGLVATLARGSQPQIMYMPRPAGMQGLPRGRRLKACGMRGACLRGRSL